MRAITFYRSAEFDPPRLAPEATAAILKDKAWRKRTGFDSIMGTDELALDRPVYASERGGTKIAVLVVAALVLGFASTVFYGVQLVRMLPQAHREAMARQELAEACSTRTWLVGYENDRDPESPTYGWARVVMPQECLTQLPSVMVSLTRTP